jgi:hypothetical protein
MLSFSPNPVLNTDGGVWATSLSGRDIGGDYTFLLVGPDGGLLDTGTVADCIIGGPCTTLQMPTTSPVSWSADDGGYIRMEQLIIGEDGTQVCTTVGEPCGTYGDCCIGLSCQSLDGGCACNYAWPAGN